MLNPNTNERELAYVVKIDNISGMDADRLECAHVRGWNIVVGKQEFDVGDLAVYFEIDSQLPDVAPFNEMEFLKSKHYKIKSQKIRGVVSQGLLMPVSAFGWQLASVAKSPDNEKVIVKEFNRGTVKGNILREGDFLTKELNVTYAVTEDNKRKASSSDKYRHMAQRHPEVAKTKWWKWLYKRPWGKQLLFLVFGRKSDKKKEWPAWVQKTDEERCQNLVWDNYAYTQHWDVTEKIDGTSTTFTMKRGKKILFWRKPYEFLVCSRNVVFNKPDKQCFYDTNYYTQMAKKYNIEFFLKSFLDGNPHIDWVTLQGETYGKGIQNRDYSTDDVSFMGFNLIDSVNGRFGSTVAEKLCSVFNIPWVPILETDFALPSTVEEMLVYADGKSVVDGKEREGVVLRSSDGKQSFKAVSNSYLLKYHA